MRAWKSLFIIALGFTILFFGRNFNQLTIDTDLKDLSPAIAKQADLQFSINTLVSNIERRFILLVAGNDADTVKQAYNSLQTGLSNINNLQLGSQSNEQTSSLVKALKPYRFQLLSPTQRLQLEQTSDADMVEQAKNTLFQLGGGLRLLPFDEDPLAMFGDYLQFLASSIAGDEAVVKSIPDQQRFYQSIAVIIQQGAMEMATQQALQAQLHTLERDIKTEYGVDILHSGIFFFAADAANKAKQDISLISTGSMIGVLILLLLAFRSIWPLCLPFLSIFLGVGFALAVTHSWYGSIHVLTIVFGASLIGIVIDYSLHFFYHQSQHRDLVQSSRSDLQRALLLSLLTSVIGYSALSLSDLDGLQKVALFSVCGLSMAWLCVVCLGTWAVRKPIHADQVFLPKLLQIITKALQKTLTRAAIPALIILILSFVGIAYIGIPSSDDPRLFFTPSKELLQQERTVSALVNDYEPGRYLIVQGENSSEVYQRLATFKQALAARTSSAGSVNPKISSVLDWLPSPQQQQTDFTLQQRLYQDKGITSQMLTALGMPDDIAQKLNKQYTQAAGQVLTPGTLIQAAGDSLPPLWIERNQRIYSFILIPKGADLNILETTSAAVAGIDFINTIALTSEALQQQRQSGSKLLGLAYLLIAALLLLRYRKASSLWMLAIPLSATMGTVLCLALLGQAITLFHTMALFLVLGLGMDYVIFAREMQRQHQVTLQAVLLSALTSLLSFGLLAISSIPVVQAFGMTVLIGNSINLISAIVYAQLQQKNSSQ